MKPYLAILLIIFLSIETHGSRVKRGLSADEREKFLEELNKDRKRVAEEEGLEYVPMKYDAALEREIVSGKSCFEHRRPLPLRINDVGDELRSLWMSKKPDIGDMHQTYFIPVYNRIGCLKEARCTQLLGNDGLELAGKTVEYHGLCMLGEVGQMETLKKAKTPSPNKYADLLGIPAISGTGRTDGKQGSGVEGSGMDGTSGKQGSGVENSGKNEEQGSEAGSVFSLIISLFLVLYI
ncbi:hypothetical protein CAEBREN_01703 [Caenorhabditis brenneri]|uniref:Uncharacterized protein n=1 Tax=Caenorhabditis brenneri TaxID=135651 RepID=G0N7D9_CAEBE|nr:hypothetical protein CAEBREN_01703 [Caenorhabditis brenneri]